MENPNTNDMNSLKLGVDEEMIKQASIELGLEFPKQLIEIWKISNGLELQGGWIIYPVFDKSNPRKTSNHIVYENTKGRWPNMQEDLISIASNGTGNQLVLQKIGSELMDEVYIWNHETARIKKWSKSIEFIKEKAHLRVDKITAQIKRSLKKRSKS